MPALRLRFRFPDGRQLTLNDVPPTDTYAALLARVRAEGALSGPPERVLLAGPPPRPVAAADDAVVSALFKSGETLIVEPPKRRTRAKTRAATRATRGRNAGKVRQVGDFSQRLDDSGDEWTPDAEVDEENDDVPVATASRKRRRTATSSAAASSGVHNIATLGDIKRKKTSKKDAGEVMETLMGEDARGLLGAELAKAVSKDADQLDACGKSFRNSLQTALQERQKEAEGERRYEAWLAKRYEIIDGGGYTFKVRYRALDARSWTEEKGMFKVPREILAEAFRDVLKNREERERLRVLSMAIVSPRSFWNMVRLFGERVEEGLMELVPESDWSFIRTRRRQLSAKARRNLEQAADVVKLD